MRRLARFLKPYRFQVTLGPIFKLIEAIFELIVPLVMADMIDRGVKLGDTAYIWRNGTILLLLGIVGLACSLTCQWLASVASQGVGTDLRNSLFSHINTLSHAELDQFGTSTLVTRMTSDINQLQVAVAMLIRLVVRAPFLAVGAIVMAMGIDLKLSLIFLAVMPIISLTLYLIMSRSVPFFVLIQKKLDRLSLITRENLNGTRVIRAFGKQEHEQQRFYAASDELAAVSIRIGKLSALLSPLSFLIMNLGIVAIIWFGGMRVQVGEMTQGQIVAFVNYMAQILLALVVVANLVVLFTKAAASAARVNEVFDTQPSVVEKAHEPVKKVQDAPKITFDHVSFRYGKDGKNALNDISFSIQKGETVGIIGGTGSSKTTLINLILRLYDTAEGQVLVDGIDVRNYPISQLRGMIGLVPQQAMLFTGTIAQNLRWRKKDADDTELYRALSIAQADDFVKDLPEGLGTILYQGGKNLSGGQKQRLTIARALVGSPEILILDDSASALDYATDAALRKALQKETKGMTVCIVSQRVSAIRHADRILLLEEGEVAGTGSHQSLYENCPVYREICLSQQNGEEA